MPRAVRPAAAVAAVAVVVVAAVGAVGGTREVVREAPRPRELVYLEETLVMTIGG